MGGTQLHNAHCCYGTVRSVVRAATQHVIDGCRCTIQSTMGRITGESQFAGTEARGSDACREGRGNCMKASWCIIPRHKYRGLLFLSRGNMYSWTYFWSQIIHRAAVITNASWIHKRPKQPPHRIGSGPLLCCPDGQRTPTFDHFGVTGQVKDIQVAEPKPLV